MTKFRHQLQRARRNEETSRYINKTVPQVIKIKCNMTKQHHFMTTETSPPTNS